MFGPVPHPYPGPLDSRVRPADCAALAGRLEDAISGFGNSGVRVPEFGRLREEIGALRAVADARVFPDAVSDQKLVGNAILDSIEVGEIARLLPAARSIEMAAQLQAAQKGRGSDVRRGQAAYRFQTQLWVGTILDHGGLFPSVPRAGNGRSPDFIVEQGMSLYGVEVKRPKHEASLKGAVEEAAKQLRDYDVTGAALLDLTEVLGLPGLGWVPESEAVARRDSYIGEARRCLSALKALAYDSDNYVWRPGYERLNAILILARGYSWIQGGDPSIVVFATGGAAAFARGKGRTLSYWHARGLVEGVIKGLRSTGFEFDEMWQRGFSR